MTRLAEELRFSLYRSTRFLSLTLARLSVSTARLCKSFLRLLASKTLAALASMDNLYGDADLFDAADYSSASAFSLPSRSLLDDYDGDDDVPAADADKVYLVSFRWWKEALKETDKVGGILYNVSSSGASHSEIVLDLRREEDAGMADDRGEGFSGREYALIPQTMWLQTIKWHYDHNSAMRDADIYITTEDYLLDMFPLQINISASWETNSLTVRISQKDNTLDFFRRACAIFSLESEPLRILDFSGKTAIFMNDAMYLPYDSLEQRGKEIPLELHVYGLSIFWESEAEKDEMVVEQSTTEGFFHSGPAKMNGGTLQSFISYRGVCFLGLTGLQNLGNTCFMNSATQCLVHTPKLVDYFLGDYREEINAENPLGMKGELALAFGDLLRKLWTPGAAPVAPKTFKMKISNFAPQFSGYNQHDAQEFLAFLLDGLHEDLNRVKCKPYIEVKDAERRPDEELAEEYWRNHLARNDSIIVDLCQGQYRSTLICPMCKKVSVTFDPFMYLSLPLPSTTMRTMTVTMLSTDGTSLPLPFTVTVPKSGRYKDLIQALSVACSLKDDETLVVAEVYNSQILRFLDDPCDSLALIRDDDKLVAYRLSKDSEASPLVVFMHQEEEKYDGFERPFFRLKTFGIPLVAKMSDSCNGSDIRQQFLNLLIPFLLPTEDDCDAVENTSNENTEELSDTLLDKDLDLDSQTRECSDSSTDFQFHQSDQRALTNSLPINMNDPVSILRFTKRLYVLVSWPKKMVEKYDTCLLSSLREVFRPKSFTPWPQESISLYKCLEAFLKEEPLGPDDMWYCPSCKEPQQAKKKLDLWRLPEILVIHLKRFSYSRYIKNKLETFVDFPIDDLDLSTYITYKNDQLSNHYKLYAVSNHYGGLGGGHYTAFVQHQPGKWYEFDDANVCQVTEDRVKAPAAYVLFYKRIADA